MDLDPDDSCSPSAMEVVQVINSDPQPNCSASLCGTEYKSLSLCACNSPFIYIICLVPLKLSSLSSSSFHRLPTRCCTAHTQSDMMCVDFPRDVCAARGLNQWL